VPDLLVVLPGWFFLVFFLSHLSRHWQMGMDFHCFLDFGLLAFFCRVRLPLYLRYRRHQQVFCVTVSVPFVDMSLPTATLLQPHALL